MGGAHLNPFLTFKGKVQAVEWLVKKMSWMYNLKIKKKKKPTTATKITPIFIQTGSKQFRKQTRQHLACYQGKEISNKDQNAVPAY